MAKRLTDNINSQYFEAINKMTPKKARRRIVVYVESYDDVFFWRSVLGRYEDDKLTFDIMLSPRILLMPFEALNAAGLSRSS